MSTQAYRSVSTRVTPQSEPIPGKAMAENNAGGFSFVMDDWKRLERFLILGSEGGTYYVKEQPLTRDNAQAVMRCLKVDGIRTIETIVAVSEEGRAVKNDPALFALAMAAGLGDDDTRKAALEALPKVARIGTHLFHFLEFVQQFRGWGRGLRRAVQNWYIDRDPEDLAYQLIKYRQRDGWTHRDALRLAHPISNQHNPAFAWLTAGMKDDLPRMIRGFLVAQSIANSREAVELLHSYPRLPWEALPTDCLVSADVWRALLPNLPDTALLRNLGRMTANGALTAGSPELARVVTHIKVGLQNNPKKLIHPLSILTALKVYQQGHGERGDLSWKPLPQIVDALDEAFYASFRTVKPTGKRIMLALDVSSSMTCGNLAGLPGITPRIGSAAMAMITAASEENTLITGFTSGVGHRYRREDAITPLDISPRRRLDDVVSYINTLGFGGTDCALPMLYALERKLEFDAFVIYTDSETWAGKIHPVQALAQYRQQTGIPAKLIVVGMTATEFSIADPNDAGMLDVVGFDSAAPAVIADFIRG